MKRILFIVSIFSLVAVMVACNSAPKTDANALIKAYQDSVKFAADTAGLAQFQAWKAQNELVDPNMYGQGAQYAIAPAGAATSSAARRSSSASRARSYGGGSMRSESRNTAKAPARKKGWSKAAKGAAIGGGVGAVAGAVINKRNRVVGGVVGGVLGAGVGYGIGRGMDKRDGRY